MSVIEVLAQRIAKVEDDLKRWREEQYLWITEKDKVLRHVAFEGNTLVWRRDTKFTGSVAVEDSNLHIYGSRVGTGNLVVGPAWDAPGICFQNVLAGALLRALAVYTSGRCVDSHSGVPLRFTGPLVM